MVHEVDHSPPFPVYFHGVVLNTLMHKQLKQDLA